MIAFIQKPTLVAVGAMLFAANSGVANAGALDTIKERGELICGVNGNAEPFGYEDPTIGEVIGYEIDLCRDLAASLGVKANPKVVAALARIPELLESRVDVLAALISYTQERAEQVDYSNTYLVDSFKCMVNKDSGITKLDDLADKRISVQKSGLIEKALRDQFPNATVLSFDEITARFLAFQQGKVDATCDRGTILRGVQLRAKNEDTTVILPESLRQLQKAGFAVRKNDPEFVAYLNKFIDEYEASGQAQDLWDGWVGDESSYLLSREFKMGSTISE